MQVNRYVVVLAGFALLTSAFHALEAKAATTVHSALDAGFVTPPGGSAKGDGTVVASAKYNYSVGREVHYTAGAPGTGLSPMDRKNYFIFDLTTVTDPIVSASVSVYAGPAIAPPFPGGTHGYESTDPGEFFVFNATGDNAGAIGDAMMLLGFTAPDFDMPGDPGVTTASMLYTKLATGPMMGSKPFSPADDGTIATIVLTDLSFLNSHLGAKVIFGGILPSSTSPTMATPQEIFGFTGPDIPGGDPLTPTLTVTTIPEPATCGAMLLLMLGRALNSRRGGSGGGGARSSLRTGRAGAA